MAASYSAIAAAAARQSCRAAGRHKADVAVRVATAKIPPGATWAASSLMTGSLAGRYMSTPSSNTASKRRL